MSMCKNKDHCYENQDHINGFVDLNNFPYVLGEYLDRNGLQQIDRSAINSNIFVDQSESMRAIIDISIDDIGKRGSDGCLAVIGNNTKRNNLLKMIANNKEYYRGTHLPTLRRGIVVRVNYQLEHYRTSQVIRSMTEDLRITDRQYFLDINSRNVDDNAIITNFSNTLVSTINEFTHGREKMAIRITNVQLFYECVNNAPKLPRIKETLIPSNYNLVPNIENNIDFYKYNEQMQHQHYLGTFNDCVANDNSIYPQKWSMFNRFYHFDDNGKNIILHFNEIYDPMSKVVLIPCGNCRVNRCFLINPGHRLIFKFSIWKNDVTFINDTSDIAQLLETPNMCCNYPCNNCDPYHHYHNHCMDNCYDSKSEDERQNIKIEQLTEIVKGMQNFINNHMNNKHDCSCHPPKHEKPNDCNCEHDDINMKLDEIQDILENITSGCNCDHSTITADDIEGMLTEIKNQQIEGE